ncbi:MULTISPECIES: nuclease-related domain-containing protein [unclassified Mycoplasma]|uniref:nuclease-related domain-containing protein n=1 Tax=unclassified Mycoplasma TaxID=2683645 RepID=UPI00211CA4FF|nr:MULTISPECIES: nuclease-related domain-containing protein [unclassified Mycoplasma]UUM20028.1 NERD domain-containing protein [Mycoplasma sp. 1578d]UUM25009.1 NERD domain-containing protein [Mycoplasma sp. 3686d]
MSTTSFSNSQKATIWALVVISLLLLFVLSIYFWRKYKQNKRQTIGLKFEEQVDNLIKDLTKNSSFTHVSGGVYSYNSIMYEIDGLLVSDSLIVVLEYKAFNGTMSGDGASELIELSSKNNRKMKFKNPILQNEKHIQHIWNTIGQKVPAASLIVFPDNLKFKIHNLEEHVILSNLSNLKTNLAMLEHTVQKLAPVTTKSTILYALKMTKTKTSAENAKFNQIINKEKNV